MDNEIVNLYITFGTLPGLYAQMNVYVDKSMSYIWTRSGGTFLEEQFYPNNLKYYKKFDGFNDLKFFEEQYKDILNTVNEIIKGKENIKFNIICDDSRIQCILKILAEHNLENSINRIIIVSEGNITEQMARDVSEEYFIKSKEKWEKLIEALKDTRFSEDEKNQKLAKIDNYAYYLSTLDNVEYLIPNLDLLIKNTSLGNINTTMNLKDVQFYELYGKLDTEIQEQFIKNAMQDESIRKEFNSNKKILIVNGTYNFIDNEITCFIYSNLINKVIDDYKKDYKIFYKAHPLYPVKENKEFEEYLNKNNIVVLPEKFPIEIALWHFPNVKIGGFCSSIHSLISQEQIEFFFGELNGFSKYIFKDNYKRTYNLELSQDMAAISLKYYFNKWEKTINGLKEEIKFSKQKQSEIENKVNQIENKLNVETEEKNMLKDRTNKIEEELGKNTKELLLLKDENANLKKHIRILEIPIYPIIWVRRKIKRRK